MAPQAFILPSGHIDTEKWDACVANAANGLIYSRSSYLHAMADNWHGVVIDDYRAVMAIPWRIKFGIRYAYTPAFIQQLGLVGDFTEQDLKAVIRTLPDFVRFADIHFNFQNSAVCDLKKVITKTNLVIDLSAGYENICSRYRKDLQENLKRLDENDFPVTHGNIEDAIGVYHAHYGNRFSHINASDFNNFLSLCESLSASGMCMVRQVSHAGEIVSIALLLKDDKRIYNLMNTTTKKGRQLNANEWLLDHVIREFKGQPLLFDFEGSDLPGVKEYYRKFGAENQAYFYYRFNGLWGNLKI